MQEVKGDRSQMVYEIVSMEERLAAGISVQTGNFDPNMGAAIGGLWARFFQEGLYEALPGKVDGKALGIYTDYAGDETGTYTAMTACVVQDDPGVPYTLCKIPAGRYARFIVRGDMVKAVAAAWEEIWKMDLPRAFLCDYEEYQDERMEDAEIHIYVGLRDEAE